MGPPDEADATVAVKDMSHESVGFLSGMFNGSQFGWAIVDMEIADGLEF